MSLDLLWDTNVWQAQGRDALRVMSYLVKHLVADMDTSVLLAKVEAGPCT